MRSFGFLAAWCFMPLVHGLGAPPSSDSVRLIEGRFDHALDARGGGLLAPANKAFGRRPLTIELWLKVFQLDRDSVLLCNEGRNSGTHWKLFIEKRTGRVGLHAAGFHPVTVFTEKGIRPEKWLHISAVMQPARVRIYLDGELAADQRLSRRPTPAHLSGLAIGMGLENRRPASVLLDDIRLSNIARDIVAAPEGPLVKDEHTVGLWTFDESQQQYLSRWTPGGETNQKGLPYPHRYAEYEFEKDPQWVDNRWQDTQKGPFLTHSIRLPGRQTGPKGMAIFLNDRSDSAVLFDLEKCAAVAGVAASRLVTFENRFGLLRKPELKGELTFYVPPIKTWRKARNRNNSKQPYRLTPLARGEADYQGLHLHDRHVLLHSHILGASVLEHYQEENAAGVKLIARHMSVDRPDEDLFLTLAETPAGARIERRDSPLTVFWQTGGVVQGVLLADSSSPKKLIVRSRDLLLRIDAVSKWRGKILHFRAPVKQLDMIVAAAKRSPKLAPLENLKKPGPRRWREPLITKGVPAPNPHQAPYVLDTIAVPYKNPFGALFFISGLDFFPNGDAAVCTAHGDVWRVSGIDNSLGRIAWRRLATGLYQPLGLKVVKGKVIVLGRDQLTRLHDANQDGEADYYESFNNDLRIQGRDHAFAMRLETDPQGAFYFLKSGAPPHGSALLSVGADGKKLRVVAAGFRHPYGLGVGPRGEITVADNEGNWVPSSKIDWITENGFYGFVRGAKTAGSRRPARPLCYLPKVADNSCGGQTWVASNQWGGYHEGQMLHLSWGRCTLHAVLQDELEGQRQAATVRFPNLTFLSGSGEGVFHPIDGQLYVVGLRGWQTGAVEDGCFQRVRYTGRPIYMPSSYRVHQDGVRLGFTQRLEKSSAEDVTNYRAEQWNYRWSSTYGSFHYSVRRPDRIGHDEVKIESATLSPSGKEVFLKIPGLKPVDQLQLSTKIRSRDQKRLEFDIYGTINFLHPNSEPAP